MAEAPLRPGGLTLARLVEGVGRHVLDVVVHPVRDDAEISQIVVHEPSAAEPPQPGGLLLGVGTTRDEVALEQVEQVRTAGSSGLVLREELARAPAVRAAAEAADIALLGLAATTTWAEAILLMASVLSLEPGAVPEGGVESGDLFALANAMAGSLGSPVTIADRSYRLLAYSHEHGVADEQRVQEILERRVPDELVEALKESGAARRLLAQDEPVSLAPRRVVAPVRAGRELLGTIWLASGQPPDGDQQEALVRYARLVAVQLLRQRTVSDVDRRIRADLVATLLEGRASGHAEADRLGLGTSAHLVLACAVDDPSVVDAESAHSQLWDAVALYLSGVHPRAATTSIGGVVYALLPVPSDIERADQSAQRIARDLIARSGMRSRVVVGVGGLARSLADIGRSRHEADQVLRVIRLGRTQRSVASLDEVYTQSLLLRLADTASRDGFVSTRRLARLFDHDREHRSCYAETLRAFLDCAGDAALAAERLHVHPNTFRYRVRKLQEIGPFDLNDPEERLGLMIEMRLRPDA